MITDQAIAESIWSQVPDDVHTDVTDVFLGREPNIGILIGFLPFRRDSEESPQIPWQRWQTPITLVQPDGSLRVQRYEFLLWWNGRPYLSISSDGEEIADEAPLVMQVDVLQRFQDNPLVTFLHLVPISISNTSTEITENNFGDDVKVAIVHEMTFSNNTERDDFLAFASEGL